MAKNKFIIKGEFIIQKMELKGGWSYILLPSPIQKTGLPFGWNIVKGTIDNYEINQYKLWPTKSGELFLPIKKEIRRKIRKGVGDKVIIELFEDVTVVNIPEEFANCLADAPKAEHFFNAISDTSKKQYIDWIYATKSYETRANRIAKAIEKLEKGLKYHEK